MVTHLLDPKDDVLPQHLRRHSLFENVTFAGFKPIPKVIDSDPSIIKCLKAFDNYEYGLIGVTTAIPSYIGWSANSKNLHF